MKKAALFICVAATALTAPAYAAAPTATTGQATDLTSTTAQLNGTVSPNQESTSYHFEYGKTTAYGTNTATGGPENGNASKSVSANIGNLSPSTLYHFRLVATNASGTATGSDATFTTAAPGQGGSVTIKANPRTVKFGKATTISGTVTGKGAAGADVELQQSAFPFTSPFAEAASGAAYQAGSYAFLGVRPGVNTRYQVRAKTSPPATSPVITVRVRPVVTLRLGDRTPARGQRVRFSGRVVPGHDGRVVRIQRRTRKGWRTISTPVLKPMAPAAGVTRSRYARRLTVRRSATYRTVFLPGDGDHVRGKSARRRARVH